MDFKLMLPGYCQIPLYRVFGNNFYPDQRVWTICGYTVVDSDNYRWLNQYKWIRRWNSGTQSYYAYRNERLLSGKYVQVSMAREVLGLPWIKGKGGDQAEHRNHDTLKNTRSNLRVATNSQNQANVKRRYNSSRFQGVYPSGLEFLPRITYNGQQFWLPTMSTEVKAALMYNYAVSLLRGDFAYLNPIPDDEMPSEEQQKELYDLVVEKFTRFGLLVVAT